MDDRLGEVLDAVAEVVRRHRGLSVMVAVADGRPGRPVIRVTERAGEVETGLVVAGGESPPKPAPKREPRRQGGRHAAPTIDDRDDADDLQGARGTQTRSAPPGSTDLSGRSSWHDALWAADRAAPAGTPDRRAEHGALRLVPDLEPAAEADTTSAPGAVALEASTSQVVSRLAQLLREDPSLASSWGREAPDS